VATGPFLDNFERTAVKFDIIFRGLRPSERGSTGTRVA
jgi:hypothetical protein